jgi:hypothetical protein
MNIVFKTLLIHKQTSADVLSTMLSASTQIQTTINIHTISFCSEDLRVCGAVLVLLELDECVMMSNSFMESAKGRLM